MKIKNEKDFFAGLLFFVLGGGFAWGATTYTVGSAARMGPGYFPLLVGVLLAVLGVLIMFKALTIESEGDSRFGSWAWKPLIFILGANLLFGILLVGLPAFGIPGMGLIVAIYGLAIVASMAGDEFKLKDAIILATVLAVGCYVIFVWALNLTLPVWPSFIAG
ncbi:MAG: tripartite tricarboxylate transporter TctB family protein [Comamonadaceae bacterium]|nr:tripartite tricarboxylate transporter TctB family protein [Burkholderiales bacterium]MEB2348678.1 tripartite tricarboxylate transporter TctB family protein [Comamonadaceae bacterium]